MLESKEERELNHWWKCKKWSYANLNRLFIRFVIVGFYREVVAHDV